MPVGYCPALTEDEADRLLAAEWLVQAFGVGNEALVVALSKVGVSSI